MTEQMLKAARSATIAVTEYLKEIEGDLSEFELQKSYISTIRDAVIIHPEFLLIHANPNEGQRTFPAAGRKVAEGIRSGIPDVFFPYPANGFPGLYIEFKKAGGVLRKDQEIICKMLSLAGYLVIVSQSARMAFDYTLAYVEGNPDLIRPPEGDARYIHFIYPGGRIQAEKIAESFLDLAQELLEFDALKTTKKIRGKYA